MEENSIICSMKMEWLNTQGLVQRTLSHKSAKLKIIRNEFKLIFMEVSFEKSAPIRLQVKGISIHKKFMQEGKASIKFQEVCCTLFISNAPPSQLMAFLRTLFVKMTGGKAVNNGNVSLRTQLLSNKPKQFDEISPVTEVDMQLARNKIGKSTTTTPSPIRKRKLGDTSCSKAPAAKKLYTSSSPLLNEPLDIEQQNVLEACLSGQSIFFTGSAGTGKSYLLRKIIGALPPDVTIATASTGVAACHIGGITLHQFAGIGGGDASLERSIELASKPVCAVPWRKCKHLIIDEISMIDADYFEKIEAVARQVRKNDKPFGGIQLILCGDFFQLPPVSKTKKIKFCFQSAVWSQCIQRTIELTRVHRQNEQDFIDILNSIRVGRVTGEVADKLNATSKQKIEQDGILATRLCSHTLDAQLVNESKLKALPGENKTFEAQDSDPTSSKQLDMQTPVPRKLELKIGAQVMLLKNINIPMGLVNGARGIVKSFKEDLPVVKFRRCEFLARHERWVIKTQSGGILARRQVPLNLAWAFSIHKSQGLTLDCVEMSLGRVFEAGQAYVALSRAQSLQTLRVLDFRATQVWANPDVVAYYERLRRNEDAFRLIPLGINKNSSNKSVVKKGLKSLSKKLMGKPLVQIT